MKYFTLLLFLFFSVTITAQQKEYYCAKNKDQQFQRLKKISEINYPGDSQIDVTYYKLDLNISYDNKIINGIVTVKAKSKVDNLTSIFLDLQNHFVVENVKVNTTIVDNTLGSNKLKITLDKSYNINEEIKIEIAYNGTPGNSGFGSFEFSDHEGNPAIWTLSEPYGASDWWPCKDTPADKVDSSDVWVTADSFFVSVSNGNLIDEINNNDGTKTYKWKNSYPIANYLISLAMTNYKLYEASFEYAPNKFMPVLHYNYPENFNSSRQENLDKTIDMLHFFSKIYGDYPFLKEKYGHAEFGWGGGMEHQTISSMGSFGESLVAHELAHQWFGDKVTCKTWRDIWVNEGFATYSEALYLEHAYGKKNYFNEISEDSYYAKQATGSIYVEDISSTSTIFNWRRTYAKGAVVLHMLRKVLGDTTFFNSCRTYLNEPNYAYGVATIRDFQSVCEEVSEEDLSYFFDEWLFGENYPKYSLNWSSDRLDNGAYSVNITLSQLKNTNPKYFTMPIDVKFFSGSGDTTITLFNNKKEQTFKVIVNVKPDSLKLDPENWVLKDIVSITSIDKKDEKVITEFSVKQNYPNPFNLVTKISYTIPKVINTNFAYNSKVSLTVYDVLGKRVKTLVDNTQKPGNYEVVFDASDFSSGIYYYRLTFGNYTKTKKMVLMK